MNPLKQGIHQNHISQELLDLLIRGKMSTTLQNYFTTSVYNTKGLQNCDENL